MILFCCASELGPPEDLSAIEVILYYYYYYYNKREQCADRKCSRLRVLGQQYILKEKNQGKKMQQRIMAGWAAYAKHRDIFKSNLAICLKRQLGVQLRCAASYDIWCRYLGTDQTSKEQTWGRPDQDGTKYAQHNIQG